MASLSLFSDILESMSASADSSSPTVPKLLYSRRESAYTLGISTRSLDLLVAAGEIRVRRFGRRRVLIPVEEVTRYASRDHRFLAQRPDNGGKAN
jgi:excisionase family DNA binding protein